MLITGIFTLTQVEAGWLLWEAPKEIASLTGEKVISSASEIADSAPEFAFSTSAKEKIPVNLFFSARLSAARSFAARSGWAECETSLVKSAGQALKNIYSGQNPSRFFPAKSWLLAKKSQDISFCGATGNKFEIYLWRLPFHGQDGTPFWAAAVYGAGAQDTLNTGIKGAKIKKQKIKNARPHKADEAFLISLR
ncbi:MAG: hypothetical protein A2X34_10470 [Elusimicrobia bacterium GWC2_51_8]|nr:MAG: hypothetical protein A2X33_10370 [Elusimicrobia bacterium GWA2_51_34]OGR65633.1 MAG: hypothetical protein A2X34_10470 [Elusimicrobia bacterium GWC2_51_8]OGR86150.1 MAG: hypothetical protein A2021_05200 [Elusimicrobia bacterium GWF2_52_66]